MGIVSAFAALMLLAVAGAEAQTFDYSGELSVQARWYPESPAFPDQRSRFAGLVLEPTFYGETEQGTSFTVTPFYRYDSTDSRRTHADLREAYILTYGDWSENSWELRVGFDRVFWGVAEQQNLVDIINQPDLVEHPRDRPKLGQPMAHLTISGDWGIAESFLLPYHRRLTFPGRFGRHRSRQPIDEDALYESGAEERHVDFALRYSNSLDLLDFGLSAFVGTSREPTFLFDKPSVPFYEQIRQFGVEAQFTTDPWLYKMEGIHRSGARNLRGREEDYTAFILGVERTLYSPFESRSDLTILAEWLYDGRGRRATNVRANDVFVAGVLAFNDVRSTELMASILADLRHDYRALSLELKRRLEDNWLVRLESIVNLRADPQDLTYDGRRDSFVGIDFTYSF